MFFLVQCWYEINSVFRFKYILHMHITNEYFKVCMPQYKHTITEYLKVYMTQYKRIIPVTVFLREVSRFVPYRHLFSLKILIFFSNLSPNIPGRLNLHRKFAA